MKKRTYHGIPAELVGIFMRDAAQRGMTVVRAKLATFVAQEKITEGKAEDQVTDADVAAQKAMIKVIEECFPLAGIIAEESKAQPGLPKKCTHNSQHLTFTIDPLDGTKAYVRKQSDGIGTMLALVESTEKNGEISEKVISVCIGDVMTDEMYYYRPGSGKIHRLHKDRRYELKFEPKKHRRLLMLDDVRSFPEIFGRLSNPEGGYFHSIAVSNGSIGTNMARLWKGEVDAVLLKKQLVTPWDLTPVLGISQKMGFKFLSFELLSANEDVLECLEMDINPLTIKGISTTLVIHKSRIKYLKKWMKAQGITLRMWREED